MDERYGVLLIDDTELVIRIYEVTHQVWKLISYFSKELPLRPSPATMSPITIFLADFFSSTNAQHIAEWKMCSKNASDLFTKEVYRITGTPVEELTKSREQELICKGIFTELW